MKYAFFIGCNIPSRVEQYEVSARAVLENLGVDLIDIRRFNCCGYPLRNTDHMAYIYSAAKNIALAEKENLDILVLCKCCFGSLKEADHLLKEDENLKNKVNEYLKDKNLKYTGKTNIKHLLSVLYHEVGAHNIKDKLSLTFNKLKIATHNGCHALRPSEVTKFDDPVEPVIFDELVKITGAKSIDWASKLECCGAPQLGSNDNLSINLTKKKLNDGKNAGADFICTACPYCQIQFDTVQNNNDLMKKEDKYLPSILYPQLLGLCMGIKKEKLGIDMNQININDIETFLTQKKKAVEKNVK